MRGEISSGKHAKRHPLDWYQEEPWVSLQLFNALGRFEQEKATGEAIWDPAAGSGAIGSTFADWGFPVLLSDVVNRVDAGHFDPPSCPVPPFASRDFLEVEEAPMPCSIVCNPPYSYCKVQGVIISELFARQALKLSARRVCLLLPTKWLSGQSRQRLFAEFPPQAVLHLSQRPSMPPGDMIAAMGNRAFRGGMVDYCWIVWDVSRPTRPGFTRAIWLPPLGQTIEPIEGLC